MANGILIMDKPSGWTSMDVCAKLRGVLHERRIGHGGTLDPMATGVLPVFVGRATRAVEFAGEADKEYVARLQLGVVTNTQDTTGEVLERRPVQVKREQLEAVLERFRGKIEQIPPMYSAIKVNGRKLYEMARKGQQVERRPRPVTIHALEVLDQAGEDSWTIRVGCSKGTYIRTLCHDIGMALGCGGCMAALRRTRAGGFSLEQAVTMEQVLEAGGSGEAEALLLPVETCFRDEPVLRLAPAEAVRVRNGAPVSADAPDGRYRVFGPEGEFLCLGLAAGGTLTTIKSFFEVEHS